MKRIRGFFAGFGRYELIAFITGFILMAYELVASRLLAPSIGSSTYVWTSVIGVMIAALALGYAFGGWLADKRVAVMDVALLLLLAAIMTSSTLVFYESVLTVIVSLLGDPRIAGVVAALALFMPTSFLLGVISPYLARLRVTSVATAGRSVASLSALNSVGGILGTFVTGFIFFSMIGSRESLGLLVVLLLVCSWLVAPRHYTTARSVVSGMLVVLVAMQVWPASPASAVQNVDTPSSHYQMQDAVVANRPVKALLTGPADAQSAVFTDGGSRDLVFAYTRAMARVVEVAPQKNRMLMLGGGVFTLPEYLARQYPQSHIDAVEIDPMLKNIAVQHFGYSSPANVRIITEDARSFVQQTKEKYDIILIDAFNELAVPFSLSTQEFTKQLKDILNPDGIVVVNFIGSLSPQCAPLLTSLHASYRSTFATSRFIPVAEPTLQQRQNIIGIYSTAPIKGLDQPGVRHDLPRDSVVRLTDNFAPVESLVQNCH